MDITKTESYNCYIIQWIACVAGGISRASAFVVVQRSREHEWRSRERIGEESSWIPACPNSLGFLNYAFTSAREFQIGWEYWNVNQMLIDTSHLSQGKRFVFIQGECEEMHRGSICIARCAFKSPRICYRGTKYEINREHVAYLHFILFAGPGCDYRDCLQVQ